MAATMAETVGHPTPSRSLPGVNGMSMAEIPVPPSFFGRTLGSLDIRNVYGVSLLLIKRRSGVDEEIVDELPDAAFEFKEGDVMLVLGKEEHLERFERAG
jgi:Trk K+ transport system NAD-binding subunit